MKSNTWIRVSDRLPGYKETDIQLIAFRSPHVFTAYYTSSYDLSMEWVDAINGEHVPEPTHWMPMPEPPPYDKPIRKTKATKRNRRA